MTLSLRGFSLSSLLVFGALAPVYGSTVQLITNGAFEGGNINGWSSTSTPYADTSGSCNTGFAANSTNAGCFSGLSPVDGTFDADMSATFPAIANNTGEYADILSQSFVAPTAPITSAVLQFDDEAVCSGSGSFRGCDVLAELYSGSTFLTNYYTLSNPGGNVTDPWSTYDWDVTTTLQAYAGQTLTLDLTSVAFFDTRQSSPSSSATDLNAAFDNVSLTVTTAPEPATTALIGSGLVLVGFLRRRH